MHRSVRVPPRVGAAAALVALALAPAGCGGDLPTRPVSGTVTIGGQPLKRGAITFVSTVGNKDAYMAIIDDGKYTTPPIPVGLCKVTINIPPPRPGSGGEGMAAPGKDKGKDRPLRPNMKYADTTTSGLEYTVVKGDNTYNPPDLQTAPDD
jgi:hypothetical protein